MPKYIISNAHVQYWTGTCWGVRQAAQDYDSEQDAVDEIEMLGIDDPDPTLDVSVEKIVEVSDE